MCKKIFQKLSSPKMLGFITLVCAGVLGTAYIMEHYYAVHPCQMCLYERQVFMVAGGVALFSLILLPRSFQAYALMALGLIFTGGAFLAAYHVAIQQHWVSLPAFCASNDFSSITSVEDLKNQLLKTPFVRCDQVTWSLFGLSLAFYNCLLSLVLALLCWKWVHCRK
jgi:disulfide bond formation protein DsbB